MLKIYKEKNFKKDVKKLMFNIRVREIVENVIMTLCDGKDLDKKYRNHQLKQNLKGYYDCHILPDLVLVYGITKTELRLIRLCNHADLLKK